MSNSTKLHLKKVDKIFTTGTKKIQILQNLECKIDKGEMIAIIGQSGVGKTTLLNIIGTLESPDKGELYLNGKDIFKLNNKELNYFRNNDVGFIFQFFHLLPDFTALENVMIPLLIGGMTKTEARGESEKALVRVGLSDRMEHFPSQLSGGEQQRVATARALIKSPKILLADEPTGNLDPKTGRGVIDTIKKLHTEDKRITIIATHNAEIAEICDRIFLLEDGILKPRKKVSYV